MSLKLVVKRFSTVAFKSTHEVFNQARPLVNFNEFDSDPVLKAWVKRCKNMNDSDVDMLSKYGAICGSEVHIKNCLLAEKNPPVLRQFDQYGCRIDVVDFHQAYHDIMAQGLNAGAASYGYEKNVPGSHMMRSLIYYMTTQTEPGHCCPITMTASAIPSLLNSTGFGEYLSKLCISGYDPRNVPISEKNCITAGMSMTEKQGGSDVRSNTTMAVPANPSHIGEGKGYYLTGHKWFTSAPMCDIFLTLAKTKGHDTPSCFIVPRWLDDGTRNSGFQVMRLKNKLGDRSNASSEVEYNAAYGKMIGAEGKGVKTIISMVQSTRLDCVIGSAGYGRRAMQHAILHATNRSAFGKVLIEQPLMTNLLADLCIENEANSLTAFYLSHLYDQVSSSRGRNGSAGDKADTTEELFRIAVTVGKYWVTKRLPNFTYECMEALGGNGFVEDFPLAAMFRQSPLNSIWEGSGNVIALDILRAAKSLPLLLTDIKQAYGQDSVFDGYVDNLERMLKSVCSDPLSVNSQKSGRLLADQLATAMQGSILIRFGDNKKVVETYIEQRMGSRDAIGFNYGSTLLSDEFAMDLVIANTPKL